MMKKLLILFILIFLLVPIALSNNSPVITSLSAGPIYETLQTNVSLRIENNEIGCDSSINNMTFYLDGVTLDGYVHPIGDWTSVILENNLNYFTLTNAFECDAISSRRIFGVKAPFVETDIDYTINLKTLDIDDDSGETSFIFTVLNDDVTPSVSSLSPENYQFINEGPINFVFDITEDETGLKNAIMAYDDNTSPLNNGVVAQNITLVCDSSNLCVGELSSIGLFPFIDFRLIEVGDKVGNVLNHGSSFPYHIYVDNENPEISLLNVPSGISTNNPSLGISYNVADNSFVAPSPFSPGLTCTTFLDWVIADTTNDLANNSVSNVEIDLIESNDGYHSWYVNCEDKAGNSVESDLRDLVLDTSGPGIDLLLPEDGNGSVIPQGVNVIMFDIYDELNSVGDVSYIYYLSGEKSGREENIELLSPYGLNVSDLEDGTYDFVVTAKDTWVNEEELNFSEELGNENIKMFTFTIDAEAPEIISFSPSPDSVFNKNVSFVYEVTDNHASVLSCKLYVDEEVLNENNAVVNGSTTTVSSVLEDGEHTFSLSCRDSVGHTAITRTYSLFVDAIDPTFSEGAPENNEWFNDPVQILSYNVYDEYGINSCVLYLGDEVYDTINLEGITEDDASFEVEFGEESSTSWRFECEDINGNKGVSEARTINIDNIKPTTGLALSLKTLERQKDGLEISWFVDDINKEEAYLRLIDPNENIIATTTDDTINFSFSKNEFSTLGEYTLYLFGNDSGGNTVEVYDNFVVQDTTNPSISSLTPVDNTIFSYSTTLVDIQFKTDEISLCRFSTNSSASWAGMIDMASTNSLSHSQTVSVTSGTSYNYFFLCEDDNSNRMVNSFNLNFSVASAPQNNVGGGGGGGGNGKSNIINTIIPIVPRPQTQSEGSGTNFVSNEEQEEQKIPEPSSDENNEPQPQQESNEGLGLLGITTQTIKGVAKSKITHGALAALMLGGIGYAGIIVGKKIIITKKLNKVRFRPGNPPQ